jgi:hypothetical protein
VTVKPRYERSGLTIGGNDAKFESILKSCYVKLLRNGPNCSTDLQFAEDQFEWIVNQTRGQLRTIREQFTNAEIVLVGYPLFDEGNPCLDFPGTSNLCRLGAGLRPKPRVESLLRALNQAQQDIANQIDRTTFVPVLDLFLTHGIAGSGQNWVRPAATSIVVATWYHPNRTGHEQIAIELDKLSLDLASSFKEADPFPRFVVYPGQPVGADILAVAETGEAVWVESVGAERLTSCTNSTFTVRGWLPEQTGGSIRVSTRFGQDRIQFVCRPPRVGDVVTREDASYLGVADSGVLVGTPGIAWSPIPTAWMYSCLVNEVGRRIYQAPLLWSLTAKILEPVPGEARCVPLEWRNRVLTAPDNRSWLVDEAGVKHHIKTTETYFALVESTGPALIIDFQIDVDTIPTGNDQPDEA